MIQVKKSSFKGIAFMLCASFCLMTSATLIKILGNGINTFEILMIESGIVVLLMLVLNISTAKVLFYSPRPALLALRSLVNGLVVLAYFWSIANHPLVEVTALQFSKPLFLIILAALFLGEKIRLRRTTATIMGFLGVLVVLHPWDTVSNMDANLIHLAVLGMTFGMAVLAVMSKILTTDHHPTTMVFYANLLTAAMCLVPGIIYWTAPTLREWILIAVLTASIFCAQYSLISAYKYAQVTVVTPFEYTRILFAALAGYFVFAEPVDIWTISGGSIICISTLFILYREAQKKRRKMVAAKIN